MQSNTFTRQIAWGYQTFRIKFILGMIILVAILIFIPHFFSNIEAREGIILNYRLLSYLPAKDVSILILIVLYGMIGLFLYRMPKNTIMRLNLIVGFYFYTADVLAAPFFIWLCWYRGKSVAKI